MFEEMNCICECSKCGKELFWEYELAEGDCICSSCWNEQEEVEE